MKELNKDLELDKIIRKLIYEHLFYEVKEIYRYTTGYGHLVFQVITEKDDNFIVRITPPENLRLYQGACFWLQQLKQLNLPIPNIIANGKYQKYHYMILNYIPGTDLNHIYPNLTDEEKREITQNIVKIQSTIEKTIPQAPKIGEYTTDIDANEIYLNWTARIENFTDFCIKFMQESKLFNLKVHCNDVHKLYITFIPYFDKIEPKPFLDDATTKNVLIHNGKLSGIIDLDWLSFGDKLFAIGLTKASLLSSGYDCKYTNYWMEELKLSIIERRVVSFYALFFCIDFMSEIGQTYNNGKTVKASDKEINHRMKVFEDILNEIKSGICAG